MRLFWAGFRCVNDELGLLLTYSGQGGDDLDGHGEPEYF